MNKIQTQYINIHKLVASDYNPRKWDEDSIAQLIESIKRFGLVDPIIVNGAKERFNIVIGGHFRLKVAKDLGYKEVPVIYLNIPDVGKEKELNLRLNRNTGEWDWDLLAEFDEDDLVKAVAKLIGDKKIIGWFQGGSEIGPRALGHRSILADPRPPSMKDHINFNVKHREWFRPLAPSVLQEKASDYFELSTDSQPFMLVVNKAKKVKVREIPSALHVDGTGRIQTVNYEENGVYYNLIKAFEDLTGTPVILNTSFNNAGEPIVESPEDAIRTFLAMNLDHLVLGNFLITKRNDSDKTI